jgi:ubiquinone/menaquinone biosynthesis C-methylase UbiE
LERLPASITESFTGAHNPLSFAGLKRGEVVLDLGCGAGLDMYFAAVTVGPEGFVHGLDISADMIAKARRNLAGLGIHNAALYCASADSIPLPDESMDGVISNGVYNLSPNKEALVKEVFRVLKPEGRTVLSEIILKKPLRETDTCDLEDWFR